MHIVSRVSYVCIVRTVCFLSHTPQHTHTHTHTHTHNTGTEHGAAGRAARDTSSTEYEEAKDRVEEESMFSRQKVSGQEAEDQGGITIYY